MKMITKFFAGAILLHIIVLLDVHAQDYNKPLTIEGLHRTTNPSVISRSMGGLTLSSRNDVTTMFSNPAGLQTLAGLQVSVGGLFETKQNEQSQRWYTLDWQPVFAMFMEGKTADFREPIPDTLGKNYIPTHQDTLPRNGRSPNWSRKANQFLPSQVFLAVPFSVSGIQLSAGIGFEEYANADYFYENITSVNRNLDYVTLPLSSRRTQNVPVDLFGDVRDRDGSIYGYGAALAAELADNFSIGASCVFISGTMKDNQSKNGYGRIEFYWNDFRYTENLYTMKWQSTSDVRGLEFTFSSTFRSKNLFFGISLKPKTKLTRDFTTTGDSTNGTTTTALPEEKGSDKITLPMRGSFALGIQLREDVSFGAEYHYNPYSLAEYYDNAGVGRNPWSDCSTIHFGLEYLPSDYLAIRFGYQTKSEVFEQQGNPLPGDAITAEVFSAGVGISVLTNIQLNIGYEYVNMHYEDNWRTNTNVNKDIRNTLFGSISYTWK